MYCCLFLAEYLASRAASLVAFFTCFLYQYSDCIALHVDSDLELDIRCDRIHTATHTHTDTLSTHCTLMQQKGVSMVCSEPVGMYICCRPNPAQGLSPMQCELSVECALEARLTHLFFPSPSHNSLFTQVIKIELKDTNGNAYSSTSSPSFPSFSGSASSAESYQSQRHNVKYFAGYARFNQSKQSAQELLMCLVCVCSSVYKYNM